MLAEILYKTKRDCWKIIRDKYPEKLDKHAIVKELIGRTLQAGDVVLDAGCGYYLVPRGDHVQFSLIGFDMVWEDVRQNRSVHLGLVSDISYVPLRSESVDIVTCNMVLEHLREPVRCFGSCS